MAEGSPTDSIEARSPEHHFHRTSVVDELMFVINRFHRRFAFAPGFWDPGFVEIATKNEISVGVGIPG
jgi:hypothetical protein